MEQVIDEETEKTVKALIDKGNQDDSENDKPYYWEASDLLCKKLKGKQVVITETYSIDEDDVDAIIDALSYDTSISINELLFDEFNAYNVDKDPISVKIKIQ